MAAKKGKPEQKGEQTRANVITTEQVVAARFVDKYTQEAVPALTKQFGYTNPMQLPRLEKIVINMGLGAAVTNPKIIDAAVEEIRAITGQKPVVTRSRKAIASFKLRAGIPIGAMVTLRKARMWEFLDRLVSIALPRTRDFRGVSRKAFDGKGNYTLGLKEQIIFQLRSNRRDQGTQHQLRHLGENRRGRARFARQPWHAVPRGLKT